MPLVPDKKTGLLLQSELVEFMREAGKKCGFTVDADDIVGANDTGRGLFIRRRKRGLCGVVFEAQMRTAEAYYCAAVNDGEGHYYSGYSDTTNYEHGSITTTVSSHDAGPHLNLPGEESGPACTTDIESDEVEGKDYGAPTDTEPVPREYSGELDPSLLRALADEAAIDSGSPTSSGATWQAFTPPPDYLEYALGVWFMLGPLNCRVIRYNYRWSITGPYAVRIAWNTEGGSHSVTLRPGETTGWISDTLPPDAGVYDTVSDVVLTQL